MAWWTTKFENYVFYRKSFSYSLAWWTNNGLKICFLWIYVQKILEKFVFFRPDWQTKFERFVFFELLYKQCSRNLIAKHDSIMRLSIQFHLFFGLAWKMWGICLDAKQKFCTLANSPTCWHKDHISLFQEQVSPRVVQKCICDLSPAVNSGKLETQSQELEVLAKNEDGLNPANCSITALSTSQKNHLLATVEPKELGKWKLFCRIGKVKVKKSSLISDSGAQGQLLPPLRPTLSIASLAVHLVDRLDAAQRHVLHKSVKENTWEKNRLLSVKCRPAPPAAC